MKGFSKDTFKKIVSESRSAKNKVLRGSFESFSLEEAAYDSADAGRGALARGLNDVQGVERYVQVEHQLQLEIRPRFGKKDVNSTAIGDHPDFLYLAGTESVENHHVCSLFLDIKNSTALSFRYDLIDVVWIKNAILRAASEIVRGMDGNVHRFMGDALLAFFGGKKHTAEDSIVNAINCCSVLEAYMVHTFIPVLVEEGFDARDIGFRIGLDYGKDDEVLWASYGFREVFEVTATSFFVDVASKLQSMARKNTAIFGDNIIKAIDFPEAFTRQKQVKRAGKLVGVDTLARSYVDKKGDVLKYKIRELDTASYRDLLPLDHAIRSSMPGSKLVSNEYITFKCFEVVDGVEREYSSVSKALPKNAALRFELEADRRLAFNADFPLSVVFEKTNYGVEATSASSDGVEEKPGDVISTQQEGLNRSLVFTGKKISVPETTLFRGLHTMQTLVKDARGKVVFRNIIGVYIV